jgi:3-hydroxybutyryl-CoA dehydratase
MTQHEIAVGQSAEFTKTVTETDVVMFAGITGDLNPAHIDQVWAEGSRFGGRIAHGMLSASFISTVLAMKLPGPGTIYLSQSLRFTGPVKIGDTVTARVEVAEVLPKRRVRLATTVRTHDGTQVIEGEAVVLAPSPGGPSPGGA